jgi:hypothetical protein
MMPPPMKILAPTFLHSLFIARAADPARSSMSQTFPGVPGQNLISRRREAGPQCSEVAFLTES